MNREAIDVAIDLGYKPSKRKDTFFVSYKKENADKLRLIVPYLAQDRIWFDKGIEYGEDWRKEIEEHIINAKGVILFLSKAVFKQGIHSYVIQEYNLACEYKKKMLCVCLEDISKEDIPTGTKIIGNQMLSMQCMLYRKDQTNEDVIREINAFIASIDSPNERTKDQGKKQTSCCDSFVLQNVEDVPDLTYLGRGMSHIIPDHELILLRNQTGKCYELRDLNKRNTLISAIRMNDDYLTNSNVYYNPLANQLYFLYNDRFYSYSVGKGAWKLQKGLKPLSYFTNEHLGYIVNTVTESAVYFITCIADKIEKVIKLDLNTNKLSASNSMKSCRLLFPIEFLNSPKISCVLFANDNDQLVPFDLEQFAPVQGIDPGVFVKILAENKFIINPDGTFQISRDGTLYCVHSRENTRIIDTKSGIIIRTIQDRINRRIQLLQNGIALYMDIEGCVSRFSSDRIEDLFSRESFEASELFCRHMPVDMVFDEYDQQYYFCVPVQQKDQDCLRIIRISYDGGIDGCSEDIALLENEVCCELHLFNRILFLCIMTKEKKTRVFMLKL